MYYTTFKTELCEIILAGNDRGLKFLELITSHNKKTLIIDGSWQRKDDFFKNTVIQLREYFAGRRKEFEIKLAPDGTEFQRRVWKQLRTIPYGETSTYGRIAEEIGRPKASRAVGTANGRNPIPIIVPCHRVIGSSGKLTGYAYGLEAKHWLLEHEEKNK